MSIVIRTLGVQASFASLVLCNLVQGMFPAVFVFAERPLSLRNVHLRPDTDLFVATAGVDEHVAHLPVLLPLCQGITQHRDREYVTGRLMSQNRVIGFEPGFFPLSFMYRCLCLTDLCR